MGGGEHFGLLMCLPILLPYMVSSTPAPGWASGSTYEPRKALGAGRGWGCSSPRSRQRGGRPRPAFGFPSSPSRFWELRWRWGDQQRPTPAEKPWAFASGCREDSPSPSRPLAPAAGSFLPGVRNLQTAGPGREEAAGAGGPAQAAAALGWSRATVGGCGYRATLPPGRPPGSVVAFGKGAGRLSGGPGLVHGGRTCGGRRADTAGPGGRPFSQGALLHPHCRGHRWGSIWG